MLGLIIIFFQRKLETNKTGLHTFSDHPEKKINVLKFGEVLYKRNCNGIGPEINYIQYVHKELFLAIFYIYSNTDS